MPRLMWIIFTFCTLLVVLTFPTPSRAGVGIATSESTPIDAVNPLLDLDILPLQTQVLSGEQLTFHWTSSDDNPSTEPFQCMAEIVIDDESAEQISWHTNTSDFTWTWTALEIQSGDCYLVVTARDIFGNTTVAISTRFSVLLSTSSVNDLPSVVNLQGPYPNPFNPSCELKFSLPVPALVDLGVYDAKGRLIKTLMQGMVAAGTTQMRWDGTDHQGRPQSGGLYFMVLNTRGPDGPVKLIRKAILIP